MKIIIAISLLAFATESVSAFGVQKPGFARTSTILKDAVANADKKEIKVGVIGAGRIGLVHLEAITKAPGVTAHIISNPTVSKAETGR